MKNCLLPAAAAAVILCLLLGCGSGSDEIEDAQQEGTIEFAALVDALDLDIMENTTLSVQNQWDGVLGARVEWTAEVYDVRASRGQAVIYAVRAERPAHRGYNIVITSPDLSRAGSLKRGETVSFRGSLYRYSSRRGRPVVLYVRDAQVL